MNRVAIGRKQEHTIALLDQLRDTRPSIAGIGCKAQRDATHWESLYLVNKAIFAAAAHTKSGAVLLSTYGTF